MKAVTHAELLSKFGDPYKALIVSVIIGAMRDRDEGFVNSEALDSWVRAYNMGAKEEIPPEAWRRKIKKRWKEKDEQKARKKNS